MSGPDAIDERRRRWLRGLLPMGAEAVGRVVAERVARHVPPRRRPPGALAEPLFLAACTRCMACIEACPHRSIFTLAEHVGLGAGTPVMVPDERPCHLCTDLPCVTACEPGALRLEYVAEHSMGTVRVDPVACLPFRGPECGACAGYCPTEQPALRIRLNKPVIDAALCVGCGLCLPHCPSHPRALSLAPLAEAP